MHIRKNYGEPSGVSWRVIAKARPKMDDAYATAFELHTLGYSVIPSGGGDKGKAPLVPWKKWQNKHPDDAQLDHWQEQYHPSQWGIITGQRGGIVVVDADNTEARALLEETGLKPHVITPRGGAHFYFKHPSQSIKTAAGILPCIDIRGDGGFVNIVGGTYHVEILPSPDNLIPWEKLPAKIKAALGSKTEPNAEAKDPKGKIPAGRRNDFLFRLGCILRTRGMSVETVYAAILAAYENDCEHKPPMSEAELHTVAESTAKYESGESANRKKTSSPTDNQKPPEPLKIRNMVDVVAEEVSWLWHPYIPIGKLTLLEGDPGVGKSFVSLAIATALSLGIALPGDTRAYSCPVLIASAEDGIADTIKPRLSAMGADTRNIFAIDGLFTLDDAGFQILEKAISDTVPGLIIIDPLVAYLSGDMDINKANQARYATSRLAAMADKYHTAVLAVRHLTKGGSQKAIYRGLGSVDFTASARSVLMAGADPNDPTNTGLVHIKSNLAIKGEAIGYELADGGFTWKTTCDLTAEKIMQAASDTSSSSLQEAKDFLIEMLASGDLPANEIYEKGESRGLSVPTIKRAKAKLKIEAYRQGEPGVKGGGKWYWKLPTNDD